MKWLDKIKIALFKRKTIIMLSLFSVFLLTFLLINCSILNKGSNKIYYKGATFDYVVKIEQNDTIIIVDTLRLELIKPTLFAKILGNNLVGLWSSRKFPKLSQKRGLNIKNNNVEIQMPTIFPYFDFELICLAPYPEYSQTLKLGYTAEISHKFLKGYGLLTGLTILQELKAVDTIKMSINDLTYLFKKTIGYNTSLQEKFGTYYGTYLFNETVGFGQIIYQYPDKIIRLELLL